MAGVSEFREQAFIDAPVGVVWELLADVDRHPERVLEVDCEGLEPGCTYREVVQTPIGKDEMTLRAERLEDCKELLIRCVNTGTFVHMLLTDAQGGTFVDGRFGMEPQTFRHRVFDAVAGRRFFRTWLDESLDAMQRVAAERASSAKSESGEDTGRTAKGVH